MTAETIHELKIIVRNIETELHKVKSRLIAMELSQKSDRHIKAAEAWLVLVKKSKGKWQPDAPSSTEITRLGRRHA